MPPAYRAQILMNLTARHLGVGEVPAAAGTVKEALLLNQRQREGLAPVYRLFSLVELSKGRVGDALEYASFAADNAEKEARYDDLTTAAYYAAAAQFLFGNLSKAARLAGRSEEAALVSGQPEWADRARFFRGRLLFEAGLYGEARDIFEALRGAGGGVPGAEKEQLVSAWAYRARVFLGEAPERFPGPAAGDLPLFELEASYLGGDYRRALALAGELRENAGGEEFFYTEQPDWRSGFAQCEWMIRPPPVIRSRMGIAYEALALARLAASGKEREAAAGRFRELLRDGFPSDAEPDAPFYFYAYYLVLRDSGGPLAEINTAASAAFNRLQRRAVRIDDVETRRAFLAAHHWNKALSLAAQEHKLI
jgi:hypothetical protein